MLAGIAVGVGFLLLARRWLGTHELSPTRLRSAGGRRALLVFLVLFVHSLPEGFAIGTAWASNREGLGLFVFLAIALQNIPEGTSVAIPMAGEGFGARDQFWAAVGTSAPQPLGAVAAFLLVDEISGLLPFSFGFAAGAMLALVLVELVPQALLSRSYVAACRRRRGGDRHDARVGGSSRRLAQRLWNWASSVEPLSASVELSPPETAFATRSK